MKKIFMLTAMFICATVSLRSFAQDDKSKRPSPLTKVTQPIKGGAIISIEYSQPSVKGRTIGKDLEPMENKVWRTGANEATVFETDKDITIDGKKLRKGKYGMFTLFNGNECTVIFNSTWNQWGAFNYKEADDVLRIKATVTNASTPTEVMTFKIDRSGQITLLWGNLQVSFNVK